MLYDIYIVDYYTAVKNVWSRPICIYMDTFQNTVLNVKSMLGESTGMTLHNLTNLIMTQFPCL